MNTLSHSARSPTIPPTISATPPSIGRSALEFPKLRRKFGNEVTYADNPKAHIRTEFGFDVTQVAKNRYTSDRYHDFIGFEVSKPVLGARLSRHLRHSTQRRPFEGRSRCRNLPPRHRHDHSRDDAESHSSRANRRSSPKRRISMPENFATTFRAPTIKKNGARDIAVRDSEPACWRSF